ncbi:MULTISPECIES: retropepsin-like aspartic protease [unclassified Leptolyngbya]|uniref:retropepsin-like aspartic protease family protein n=1 Tax=unclassified Leptolyngbya TaxID=2650499 RepID=UPI001686642E|nr:MULTISPECIES: retropepsin-like aspartic protease [unclassified Leptolyngbya]MBD1911614.1 retroviral-like aspartic protease family protein [Leptolyngbya sp. FACHB-8]MBD2155213.1 retroviral-like aspartic protease family protein [Leptolyngbya sp. FACHB-16]
MDSNEDLRKALLQRAQQGDAQAIASLMNQSLQKREVTAKVTRMGDRLKILLESEQVPEAEALTQYLQTSLTKLRAVGIRSVQVMGRQRESAKMAWNRSFELEGAAPSPTPTATPGVSSAGVMSRATASHTVPMRTVAARSQPSGQIPQFLLGAIVAVILILMGANIRSMVSLVTGTPNFVASSTGSDGRYEAPIVDSLYGIPVINVNFNGQTFPMMVDTGASGTLVTQPMAAALRIRPVGQVESSTANGTAVFDVGYVRSIEVDGATVYNVPVAVGMSDLEIGLLGHDFFQYFDVTIRQNVVEFHPRAK